MTSRVKFAAERFVDHKRWLHRGGRLGATCIIGLLVWSTLVHSTDTSDTVIIVRGDIESHVTALGTLQPRRYVDVGAQVSGQIRRIFVQPGDVVKKGQLLAEIDPSLPRAKVDADRAALTGLKFQLADQQAQLALAQQQYARQRRLAQRGATREEDVQIAQATLRSAAAKIGILKAQIDQMQSTLKGDKAQLGYTRIYAPMAGTVVSLETHEGQTLNAVHQAPLLLRIADLSTMTVWTDVSEADVQHVKPGMPVYFTTLGVNNHRWTSKVRQILPAPSNKSGLCGHAPTIATTPAISQGALYTVLFDVANTNGELMPQMTAQVFFVTARVENVITAPLSFLQAVTGQAGDYTARVLDADGQITTREVRTGVRNRLTVEVLSGLAVGDKLVIGSVVGDSFLELPYLSMTLSRLTTLM
jgi:membrane fusion protein, macrolide-specific efflux system